jgi:hypothetical protein
VVSIKEQRDQKMEVRNIDNDIATLPPEAQRQVFDFVAFLKNRYKKRHSVKKAVKDKIVSEPFIGIWEGREEMKDSSQWVRKVRAAEWGGS